MKIIVEDSDTIMKAHGLDNEEIQEALIKQMTIEIKDNMNKEEIIITIYNMIYKQNTTNKKSCISLSEEIYDLIEKLLDRKK